MLSQQPLSATTPSSPSPYPSSSPISHSSPPLVGPPTTTSSVSTTASANGVVVADPSSSSPQINQNHNHLQYPTSFTTSTQSHQQQQQQQQVLSSLPSNTTSFTDTTSTIPTHQQQQHHFTSYQQQSLLNQYERSSASSSSYLDSLSESPSISVLSPHMGDPFSSEGPIGSMSHSNANINGSQQSGGGGKNQNQHLNGITDDQPLLYRSNPSLNPTSGFSAAVGGRLPQRPSQQHQQNSLSPFEDVASSYVNHDLYSTSHHHQMSMPQLNHDGRQGYDLDLGSKPSGFTGSMMRSGSIHLANGPYGTGSTLPESQQVAVNKAIQQQVQQLVQQQVQQQQQQQLHHQQQQFASQQQQQLASQAQAIINNLPPGVSSRDYLLALQNAQVQAMVTAQSSGAVPNSNLPGGASGLNLTASNTTTTTSSSQEEISTIFVVGFPDDMQEREFQNMFTFCPGFEAATLKVPHKELTSFGATSSTTAAQAAAAALRSAGFLPPGGQPTFVNSNTDPFAMLNANATSGGALGDAQSTLWSSLAGEDPYRAATSLNLAPGVAAGGSADLSLLAAAAPPPRKQIIGFAKFRTRQEALDAREVLQGRRVDMEKGSILKAEMAKKNLHTKRGVGPSGTSGGGVGASNSAGNVATASGSGSTQQQGGSTAPPVLNAETLAAGLAAAGFSAQQIRDLGLTGVAQQPQVSQQQQAQQALQQVTATGSLGGELFNPREREMSTAGLNGLASAAVGSNRERDRERERDFGELRDSRSRHNTLNAYEAFHSVPASLPPRPVPFSTLPPVGASARLGPVTATSSTQSLANGISLPGSSYEQGVTGGSTTPRHGSGSSAFSAGLSMDQGLSSGTGSLSMSPMSALGESGMGGGSSATSSNLWSTSGLRDPVDPQDTSGGLAPGPASVVGGPTSSSSSGGLGSSLHHASSVHTLSRQPSSSFQHSSPEQDHATLALPNVGGANPGVDQRQTQQSAQHSPAAPQIASPPLFQTRSLGQTQSGMFGLSGLGVGPLDVLSGTSSRGSAESASPPEKYQQQRSIFDGFSNSSTASAGTNGGTVTTPSQSSLNNYDSDMARAMAGLSVANGMSAAGTHPDMTSPQLPSPGSGGSGSGSRPNAADQNPPINTLYVGNLPSGNAAHPSTLEEGLRGLFSRCAGYRKLCFRQKSNGPMCFVEFDDVPCATKALNELYGHNLSGLVKGGIRLSFSKNPLGVRAGSMSSNGGSMSGTANLFSAALAGITETRYSNHGHLLQQRHASLSGLPSYAADMPLPRANRQESIDVLPQSTFNSLNSFGFGGSAGHIQQQHHRSFSPSSYQQQQQQPLTLPQNPILPTRSVSISLHSSSQQHQQPSSLFSSQPQQHHSSSLIDSGLNHHSLNLLNHTSSFVDPRDSHFSPFSSASNTNSSMGGVGPGFSPSPQPGIDP